MRQLMMAEKHRGARSTGGNRPPDDPASGFQRGVKRRRALRLRLPSPLDPAEHARVTEAIDVAQRVGVARLVVDMSEAPMLSDDELAVLLTLHANAGRLQDHISLVGVSPTLMRQLAEGGISSLFHLVPADLDAAEDGTAPTVPPTTRDEG